MFCQRIRAALRVKDCQFSLHRKTRPHQSLYYGAAKHSRTIGRTTIYSYRWSVIIQQERKLLRRHHIISFSLLFINFLIENRCDKFDISTLPRAYKIALSRSSDNYRNGISKIDIISLNRGSTRLIKIQLSKCGNTWGKFCDNRSDNVTSILTEDRYFICS